MLYKKTDSIREYNAKPTSGFTSEEYRTSFRRDYARILHSAAFRRLGGKTQLFPSHESDYFRTRLTHSLEVAQIAKSIAIRINNTDPYFKENNIDTDLVEAASLAHDIGHPPFGHNGEQALDECMKEHGGFEGNAQTLRILAKLEKKSPISAAPYGIKKGIDQRKGLNLCHRTLAATLKYDKKITTTRTRSDKLTKGYYYLEEDLVKNIKASITGESNFKGNFKTIECQIMDIADDIAYSTYDLDDSFKAGFLTPLKMISADNELLENIAKEVSISINRSFTGEDVARVLFSIFKNQQIISDEFTDSSLDKNNPDVLLFIAGRINNSSQQISETGYTRNRLSSELVGEFIRGVEVTVNKKYPALSKAFLKNNILEQVEVLKYFTREALIMSSRLKVAEFRGHEIIDTLFKALSSKSDHTEDGHWLMPDDFRVAYEQFDKAGNKNEQMRVVCDFIAGMTDRYAIEFYGRLKSEQPQTIFKPL